MENGMSPTEAAEEAILRIAIKDPTFSGALIAINKKGEYGAAAFNANDFYICVRNDSMESTQVIPIPPLSLPSKTKN